MSDPTHPYGPEGPFRSALSTVPRDPARLASGQLSHPTSPVADRRAKHPLFCEERLVRLHIAPRAIGLVNLRSFLYLAYQEEEINLHILRLATKAIMSRIRPEDVLTMRNSFQATVVLQHPLHGATLATLEQRLEEPVEFQIGSHSFYVCATAVFQNSLDDDPVDTERRLEEAMMDRLASRARSGYPCLVR